MSIAELHVHVPGLLGPLPADAAALVDRSGPAKHLELLLHGAYSTAVPQHAGYQSRLRLFGLDGGDEGQSVGALSALGDGLDPDSDQFFLADPVHLVPDRDRLLVTDPGSKGGPSDAVTALMAELNAQLVEDNLEVLVGRSGRWYLRSKSTRAVHTLPLDRVLGRSMSECLPGGEHAGEWMRILNTVQMLLHDTELNRQRLAQGRPALNGLWPWGGGRLPSTVQPARWKKVFSDTPLTRGLCMLAQVECAPLSDAEEVIAEAGPGPSLIDLPEFPAVRDTDTFDDWQHSLRCFGEDWAGPLFTGLRHSHVRRLVIHAGACRIEQQRALIPRLWRRRRLREWLVTR